jgi:adenine-specific DNA-methyltransferase
MSKKDDRNMNNSKISMNYPKIKKLSHLTGYLFQLTNQGQLFEIDKHEKTLWNKKVKDLTDKIKKLETEIEKFKVNKIHHRRRPTEAQRILFIPLNPGRFGSIL